MQSKLPGKPVSVNTAFHNVTKPSHKKNIFSIKNEILIVNLFTNQTGIRYKVMGYIDCRKRHVPLLPSVLL
jgi:hypothetical protein